jgi:streptogramin lyase
LIRTSRGLGNALAWRNADGADSDGGVATADDECVLDYTRVAGTNVRTVAIDARGDVWIGGLGNQAHEKLDGATGQPIASSRFDALAGGYGGLVDGRGVLWSARGGKGLLRYDTASGASTVLGNDCGDYGLAIDPATGNVWHTGLSTGTVCLRDPRGECVGCYAHGSGNAQGVAVDARGNVWVAHSLLGPSTTVGRLKTDGSFVGNVPLNHPRGNGSGPTGVAIDARGKVWVPCHYSNNVLRIDPSAGASGSDGAPVGGVDLVVDLGAGAAPYNYGDMTGFVGLAVTAPAGVWSKVHDGGERGRRWSSLAWTSREPAGTSVVVEARAADSQADLTTRPFERASNARGALAATGRYLELRATLARGFGVSAAPELLDLTIGASAQANPVLTCPPNFAEVWNGGAPAEQLDPARTGIAKCVDACARGARLTHEDLVAPASSVPGAPEAIVTRRWKLTDECGGSTSCDQTLTLFSAAGLDGAITLDIEPGRCPNTIDALGAGATNFALASTWLLDARSVDAVSLRLRRADGVGRELALTDLPLAFEDVTRPYYGERGACEASSGEGLIDAVVSVPNWMLRRAFGLDALAPGPIELVLTGRLADGTSFEARDSARVP